MTNRHATNGFNSSAIGLDTNGAVCLNGYATARKMKQCISNAFTSTLAMCSILQLRYSGIACLSTNGWTVGCPLSIQPLTHPLTAA